MEYSYIYDYHMVGAVQPQAPDMPSTRPLTARKRVYRPILCMINNCTCLSSSGTRGVSTSSSTSDKNAHGLLGLDIHYRYT